jgi:hypothetical protein
MRIPSLTLTVAFAASLSATALAQTRFCLGGDLSHLSQAQKSSCNARLSDVRELAVAMHAPADWHFVVVCSEQGWQDYAAYTMNTSETLLAASADTNLEQHETFLREGRLGSGDRKALQAVVAHEIAGIRLHSKDEVAINTEAARLINESAPQSGI